MFFFFNDTATTEIYTLSLHDALPILPLSTARPVPAANLQAPRPAPIAPPIISPPIISPSAASPAPSPTSSMIPRAMRSEEHTSELQSQSNLVCRLLLEKKKDIALIFAPAALVFSQKHPEHGQKPSAHAKQVTEAKQVSTTDISAVIKTSIEAKSKKIPD